MGYLDDIKHPDQDINPLFNMLGVVIHQLDEEQVVLHLPFKHDLLQGGGLVAGGVLATLLDEAMAHAVLARLTPGTKTATIDMTVQYLRAAGPGTDLTATARVNKQGNRILFAEAEVTGNGKTMAKATASFLPLG